MKPTNDESSAAFLWLRVCIKLSDAVRAASSAISQTKDSRKVADKDKFLTSYKTSYKK